MKKTMCAVVAAFMMTSITGCTRSETARMDTKYGVNDGFESPYNTGTRTSYTGNNQGANQGNNAGTMTGFGSYVDGVYTATGNKNANGNEVATVNIKDGRIYNIMLKRVDRNGNDMEFTSDVDRITAMDNRGIVYPPGTVDMATRLGAGGSGADRVYYNNSGNNNVGTATNYGVAVPGGNYGGSVSGAAGGMGGGLSPDARYNRNNTAGTNMNNYTWGTNYGTYDNRYNGTDVGMNNNGYGYGYNGNYGSNTGNYTGYQGTNIGDNKYNSGTNINANNTDNKNNNIVSGTGLNTNNNGKNGTNIGSQSSSLAPFPVALSEARATLIASVMRAQNANVDIRGIGYGDIVSNWRLAIQRALEQAR